MIALRRALPVLICAGLGFVTQLHHEWWRDEATLWLILRNSHSAAEMLRTIGFNGHPRLYYLANWFALRAWTSPQAILLLNLLLSVAAVGLFAAAAPFTVAQKLLFAAGFFPVFQWGVTLRSYSMMLFFLFAYCWLKTARPQALALRTLALVLLAQVHIMSMAAAIALWFLEWRERRRDRALLAAGAAVAASVLFAAWQILQPAAAAQPRSNTDLGRALLGLGHAFWPDFAVFLDNPLAAAAGLILWALGWVAIRRDRAALIHYAALSATLVAISLAIYSGYRWHHGFYFIYFLAALWLTRTRPLEGRFVTTALAVQAAMGIYAAAVDLRRDYSNGPAVAELIRSRSLEQEPLVGIEYRPARDPLKPWKWDQDQLQAVTVHLPGKRMENPQTGGTDLLWTHYSDTDYFPMEDADSMKAALQREAMHLGRSYLVVIAWPRGTDPGPAPAPLEKISDFPRPVDYGENFSLYRCPPPSAQPAASK